MFALRNIWGEDSEDGHLRGKGDLALKTFDKLMERRAAMLEDPVIKKDHPHIYDYLIDLIARDEAGLELLMLTAEICLENRYVPTLEQYTRQCSEQSLEFAITAAHEDLTNALNAWKMDSQYSPDFALASLSRSLEIASIIISSQQPNNRATGYFRYILDEVISHAPDEITDKLDEMDSLPDGSSVRLPDGVLSRSIADIRGHALGMTNIIIKWQQADSNAPTDYFEAATPQPTTPTNDLQSIFDHDPGVIIRDALDRKLSKIQTTNSGSKMLARLADKYPDGKIPTYDQYLKMKHLPPSANLGLDIA